MMVFPHKAQRSELNKLVSDNGLWSAFSALDTHKLSKAMKEGTLPGSLNSALERFITKRQGHRVAILRRA